MHACINTVFMSILTHWTVEMSTKKLQSIMTLDINTQEVRKMYVIDQ